MAQQQYRINLAEVAFPFLSTDETRDVMYGDSGAVPKIYFGQNVMPFKEGIRSVGFSTAVPSVGTDLIDVRIVYSSSRVRCYLAWASNGDVYCLKDGAWQAVSSEPTLPTGFSIPDDVSIGTCKGVSYIFYKQTGGYTFDYATLTFSAVTFNDLNTSEVLAISSSFNYLIAVSEYTVAWSSLIDPTDFAADSVTGAGSGDIPDIDGAISFVTPSPKGFLLYAEANIVAATYTGNSQYPFKFREVIGSKGGISLDSITYEANTDTQFAYTTGGLQAVSTEAIQPVLPELSDFFANGVVEDFSDGEFSYTSVDDMLVKLKLVSSRYLVASYGVTSYTHAIILDTFLNKLGKVKIAHTDVFEYGRAGIAFVCAGGEVKRLDYDKAEESVALLGKLSFSRSRTTTLLEVEVESAGDMTVVDYPSLNGKALGVRVVGYQQELSDSYGKWLFKATAVTHSLMLSGAFKANTVLMTYTINGRR